MWHSLAHEMETKVGWGFLGCSCFPETSTDTFFFPFFPPFYCLKWLQSQLDVQLPSCDYESNDKKIAESLGLPS